MYMYNKSIKRFMRKTSTKFRIVITYGRGKFRAIKEGHTGYLT